MIDFTTSQTEGASGTVTKAVDVSPDVRYTDRKRIKRWLQKAFRRGLERGRIHDGVINCSVANRLYEEKCPDLIPRMFGDPDEEDENE